jgi:hypothetical protein
MAWQYAIVSCWLHYCSCSNGHARGMSRTSYIKHENCSPDTLLRTSLSIIRRLSKLIKHAKTSYISRLNTRALLERKKFFRADYTCIMCNGSTLETRDHLFFTCPFAVYCWRYLCPR